MSLVVICMALAIISMQGAFPTGAILIFTIVIVIPALLVDVLVFVGFSRTRYDRDHATQRHKSDGPSAPIEQKSDNGESA